MHLESFLNYLRHEKRYSEHTLVSYQNDLTQFFSYLQEQYALHDDLTVKHIHIRSWLVTLMEVGLTARTVNRKLSAIKSYFRFLMNRGFTDQNPTTKVVAPKVSKRLPEYVEQPDMQRLFEQIQFSEGFPGARDRLVLEILYATGMRLSELINLRQSDVDLERSLIKVMGKGSKERLIPVGENLKTSIHDYLALSDLPNNPEGYFLLTDKGNKMYPNFVYRLVRRCLGKITTLTKKSPHILRHTFATHLSNAGADLNAVKELLGHSSLAATQVYTHNNIQKLKDIYKQTHPKA